MERPPRFEPAPNPQPGVPLYWQSLNGRVPNDTASLEEYQQWFADLLALLDSDITADVARRFCINRKVLHKRLHRLTKKKEAPVVYRALRDHMIATHYYPQALPHRHPVINQLRRNYTVLIVMNCEDPVQWAYFQGQCLEVVAHVGNAAEDRVIFSDRESIVPELMKWAAWSTPRPSLSHPIMMFEQERDRAWFARHLMRNPCKLLVPPARRKPYWPWSDPFETL